MKKTSCLLALLLMLAPIAQLAAQTQKHFEKAKENVSKLGVGTKAKAKITLNDGSIVKGYIDSTGDGDFVIRDGKTDSPTIIRYADVKLVESNRPGAKNKDLLIGLGAAAVGVMLFAVFATRGGILR